jgi:hypothetical protein
MDPAGWGPEKRKAGETEGKNRNPSPSAKFLPITKNIPKGALLISQIVRKSKMALRPRSNGNWLRTLVRI